MDPLLYDLSYNAGHRFIEDGGDSNQAESLSKSYDIPEAFLEGVKDGISTLNSRLIF